MRFWLAPALLAWLIVTLGALSSGLGDALALAYAGPDDAMRFLQVQEWLAGRAWHDLTQPRVGLNSLEFHWSRLPDIPIAALALLFSIFLEPDRALIWAAALWPPVLLLGLFASVVFLAGRERGFWAAVLAALLAMTAYRSLDQFGPGDIDHHNLQIVLAGVSLLFVLMSVKRAIWAVGAGLCAALAIGIGLEGAPYAVAAAAVLGIFALQAEPRAIRALLFFGLSLSAGLALIYLQSGVWLTIYAQSCVAFSNVMLGAGVLLGAGCAGCAFAFPRLADWRYRLGAGAIIGAVAAGLFILLYPQCPAIAWSPEGRNLSSDPLDAALAALWLGGVQETLNIAEIIHLDYRIALATYAAPIAALGGGIWLYFAEPRHRDFIIASGFYLGLAVLISLAQNRAAMFSQALAVPLAAVTLAVLLQRARASAPGALAGLIAAALAVNGLTYVLMFGLLPDPGGSAAIAQSRSHDSCVSPARLKKLNALTPGLIAAPINLGPAALLHSHHRVLAAPYSTNLEGTVSAYRILSASPEASINQAIDNNVNYIGFCVGSKEEARFRQAYPEGVLAQLSHGKVVVGLRLSPISDDVLQVYEVERVSGD